MSKQIDFDEQTKSDKNPRTFAAVQARYNSWFDEDIFIKPKAIRIENVASDNCLTFIPPKDDISDEIQKTFIDNSNV